MDKKIHFVLDKLNSNNHKAYIVGGAIRDILLNKKPLDYDITTSARPNEVIELFSDFDMYTSGLKHGTVTIIIDKTPIEITTFRKDGPYRDFRHPDEVYFSDDVLDDLKRRDFTMNSILMDINENIIDPLNAKEDINNKIIKAIGDPDRRFKEDALRVLRALRFKAQLNFSIEENTNEALLNNALNLINISSERKADEFLKTIKSKNLEVLKDYKEVYNSFIDYDFIDDIYKSDDLIIRLALLFKDKAQELNKLFLNKNILKTINNLIKYKDLDDDNFIEYLSNINDINRYIKYIEILKGINIKAKYDELSPYIVNNGNLNISSKTLMNYGYKNKELGEIRRLLIDKIRNKELQNNKEDILNYLKVL